MFYDKNKKIKTYKYKMNNNKYQHLYMSDSSSDKEEEYNNHIVQSINKLLDEDDEQEEFDIDDESGFEEEGKKKKKNNVNFGEKLSYDKSVFEKYYIDPIILNNIDLLLYFDKNDIDLVKIYNHLYKTNYTLKITDKGLYSISKPQDAEWITNEIKSIFPNIKTIIDGTAGIGGDVISFSRNFENVIGIELNKVHYDVLENNVKALRLDNVKIYQDNILEYYKNIENKEHVIFFMDPPWGGKKYKNFKNFILKIGKYCIHEFVEELYKTGYKQIVLKAPLNLNINLLIHNISYKNVKVVKHINMLLLLIY